VNRGFTTHIEQLTRAESGAVLNALFRHIEASLAFQTRVQWRPGTLLLWDNWASQHHAVWDYYPFERQGARVPAYLDQRPAV
jgi:taurine dioxygenase